MLSHHLYFLQWTFVFLLIMPVVAIGFDLVMLVHRFDRRRRLAFRRVFSPKRAAALLGGILLLGGLMFFQGSFTSVKNLLPTLRGSFIDDRYLADLDAWLHAGVDPWTLFRWIFDVDGLLHVLEFNYNVIWFLICFGTLFFVATSPLADRVRKRYMLLFIFVWIMCGNVLAGVFLSAGPAFYGYVVGDHVRFNDLVTLLGSSDRAGSAASFQAYLWALHERGQSGFGSGISAFPSIHVGLIMLNALFLNSYSRTLGVVAFVYVAIIQISSVCLGWHYAIDGYMSVIVVSLAYAASSMLMRPRAIAAVAAPIRPPAVAV